MAIGLGYWVTRAALWGGVGTGVVDLGVACEKFTTLKSWRTARPRGSGLGVRRRRGELEVELTLLASQSGGH